MKMLVLFLLLVQPLFAGLEVEEILELRNRETLIADRLLMSQLEPLLEGRVSRRTLFRNSLKITWKGKEASHSNIRGYFGFSAQLPWSMLLTNNLTNSGWESLGFRAFYTWRIGGLFWVSLF